MLIQALRNEDVWLAYSRLRGPEGGVGDAIWILVDIQGRVFASNRPRQYRLDQPLAEALPWLTGIHVASAASTRGNILTAGWPEAPRLLQ